MPEAPAIGEERDPAYFGYYAQLVHQQNMLSDHVRTSTYHRAIVECGQSVFRGATVMDVGAGSGVLSFFACQAGAAKVYAVEASGMAEKLKIMVEKSLRSGKNQAWLRDPDQITILNDKVESDRLLAHVQPGSVDILISEPIGVFLVHERMLESFLYARDTFLKREGGQMFPSTGTIFIQPFSDAQLWLETSTKAQWWHRQDFFGVDFTPMVEEAKREAFSMPVVGFFPAATMLSSPDASGSTKHLDFQTMTQKELVDFTIPIRWFIESTGIVHGIGGWFDCEFPNFSHPNQQQQAPLVLTTQPGAPATHWQQVRFLLADPLAVNSGDWIVGQLHCVANKMRSYDVSVDMWIDDGPGQNGVRPNSRRTGCWFLQEQVYNYSHHPGYAPQQDGLSHSASIGGEQCKEWYGMYPANAKE